MNKIFITGSTGFIGEFLFKNLGSQVSGVNLRNSNFKFLPGSSVIHAANDACSNKNNLLMLSRVVNKAVEAKVSKIIFLMSYATLTGSHDCNHSLNFGFKPIYMDDYARSKLKQEKLARRLLNNSGISFFFLYLPAVIGEGGAWNGVFKKIAEAESAFVPSSQVFNFCNLLNILDTIKNCLNDSKSYSLGKNLLVCDTFSSNLNFYLISKKININTMLIKNSLKDRVILNSFYRFNFFSYIIQLIRKYKKNNLTKNISLPVKTFKFNPFYSYVLSSQKLLINAEVNQSRYLNLDEFVASIKLDPNLKR